MRVVVPAPACVAVAACAAGGALAVTAGAATAPVQPVATGSEPPARHELRSGEVVLAPAALVAGAPDQELRLDVALGGETGPEIAAVLYRPRGRDPRHRDAAVRPLPVGSALTRLGGGPDASRTLALTGLDPPPGKLALDLVAVGAGDARLVGRVSIPAYAQHRLPPGLGPSGPQPGPDPSAAGSLRGTSAEADPRALPVGGVNNNLTGTVKSSEAETYAAVNPEDPNRAIAGVNPGARFNPGAWISNGGLAPGTIVSRLLPSTSRLENGQTADLRLCCDPALAADRDGNLWYAVLALGRRSHIVINRVAAGTTEFQPANVAIPRGTNDFQDKPMITIDSWPSSPKYGRLYAAWVQNDERRQNVVVSECDTRPGGVPDAARCDDPANWTPGAALPAITDTSSIYTYPSVAAAPSGDVYVAWWNAGRPPGGNEIEIDSCAAGADCRLASSWGVDTTIDDLDQKGGQGIPFFCPIRPAPGGRVGPQPYVDVGPDGTVHVAFSDLRRNGNEVCTASRRERTFDSFIAAGAAPNSYPAPNSGVRLSDDAPTARNHHFFPSLTVDPSTGEVQSNLYSTVLDPGAKTTLNYYVRSTDGGLTYSAMQPISTAASNFSGGRSDGFDYGDYAGADSAEGVFLPTWTDNRKLGARRQADLFALTPP